MQLINYSEARNNLKSVLDDVSRDAGYTVISQRDSDDAIIIKNLTVGVFL